MTINKDRGFRIYYNLHKGGFTVQHWVEGKGWRKKDTIDSLMAYNATFKVYENGRQKVIKEKQKNVHAFILCEKFSEIKTTIDMFSKQLYYNPYKTNAFIDKGTQKPVDFVANLYLDSFVRDTGKKAGAIFYNR
jgi:hypothetical protein